MEHLVGQNFPSTDINAHGILMTNQQTSQTRAAACARRPFSPDDYLMNMPAMSRIGIIIKISTKIIIRMRQAKLAALSSDSIS